MSDEFSIRSPRGRMLTIDENLSNDDPVIAFTRHGIAGVHWFCAPVTARLLAAMAANPRVSAFKDGPVICPAALQSRVAATYVDDGTMFGRREQAACGLRTKESLTEITLLIYDVENNRQLLDDLRLLLAPFRALYYTTPSHNPEGVTLVPMAAVRSFVGKRTLDDVDLEDVTKYACANARVGGLGLKANPNTFHTDGMADNWDGAACCVLRHQPLFRYRIVIFLADSFGVGATDWSGWSIQDRARIWKFAYRGWAQQHGLDVDLACDDLPHASYLPSVHPDRTHTYEAYFQDGLLICPTDLLRIGQAASDAEDERRSEFAAREVELGNDLNEVQAALSMMSAGCDYVEWRNIIWAIKSGFGDTEDEDAAMELLDAWSQTDPSFSSQAFERVWNDGQTDIDGGITMGTFWHHASEQGFDRPTYRRLTEFKDL